MTSGNIRFIFLPIPIAVSQGGVKPIISHHRQNQHFHLSMLFDWTYIVNDRLEAKNGYFALLSICTRSPLGWKAQPKLPILLLVQDCSIKLIFLCFESPCNSSFDSFLPRSTVHTETNYDVEKWWLPKFSNNFVTNNARKYQNHLWLD